MRKYLIGIIVLLTLTLVYFYRQAQSYEANYQRSISNIEALQDSIQGYRTTTGELGSQKRLLQARKEDLELLNDSLKEELEKEKGRVKTITKIRTQVRRDTVRVPTTVDSTYTGQLRFHWDFSERYGDGNYTSVRGWSTRDTTTISRQSIGLSLVTGIREENNQPYIFIRSQHPHLEIKSIEGAIVDEEWFTRPDKDRWVVGPFIGAAYSERIMPVIGVGVTYNLFSF